MLDQTFSKKSLEYSFTKSDFDFSMTSDQIVQFKNDILNRSLEIIDSWQPPSYVKGYKNKRTVYKMDELSHLIVVRNLISILKKIYKIKHVSRDNVIREMIPLLSNPSPYQVVRLDISKFYDSIPLKDIFEKIKNHPKISAKTVTILYNYLQSMNSKTNLSGLMQGHPLSAILSEIVMFEFDQRVRSLDDVLLYHRYVDDIILITCSKSFDKKKLLQSIKDNLPYTNLKFNNDKENIINFNKLTLRAEFNFLGYVFSIENRNVQVSVYDKKIRKLKNKIFFSIKHFNKKTKRLSSPKSIENELLFFLDSMKCLASSSIMRKKNKSLPVGNRLNYKFSTCNGKSFHEVDVFLHSLPYLNRNPDIKKMNEKLKKASLHNNFSKEIRKISLQHFFNKGIFIQFPREKSKKIWEVWKYV